MCVAHVLWCSVLLTWVACTFCCTWILLVCVCALVSNFSTCGAPQALQPTWARRIAAVARADGLLGPGLLTLWSLGCNGVHDGNTEWHSHRSFNSAAALSLQPQLIALSMVEKWRKLRGTTESVIREDLRWPTRGRWRPSTLSAHSCVRARALSAHSRVRARACV